MNGQVDIPLPVYFGLGKWTLPAAVKTKLNTDIGDGGKGKGKGWEGGGEVCTNLFFWGRKGVVGTSEGVRIVGLGGRLGDGGDGDGEAWYTEQEASALRGANQADILVTYDWAAGVERGSQVALPSPAPEGTVAVRELVRRLRPRYHFSVAGFWEREPYKIEFVGRGEREKMAAAGEGLGATRFIALGDYGNKGQAKALYAFNINMAEKRSEIPANATESPFAEEGDGRGRKRGFEGEVSGNGNFFWGGEERSHRGGRGKRGRGGRDGGRLPPGRKLTHPRAVS